jgi:hypothetical protein
MKPILFNTEMVQAILDGRKTVTRRVIKPQLENAHMIMDVSDDTVEFMCGIIGNGLCIDFAEYRKLPYHIGDILYVRETWRRTGTTEEPYAYKAEEPVLNLVREFGNILTLCYKWRPSIHMPKEAARIFLRVTGVRAERLQDITEDGAWDEGVGDPYDYQNPDYYDRPQMLGVTFKRAAFAGLWDSIIKPNEIDQFGWDANPWVWVIEFERISKKEAIRSETFADTHTNQSQCKVRSKLTIQRRSLVEAQQDCR